MSTGQLQPLKAGSNYITVKHRNAVSDTITAIQQHSGHHTLGEKGHECLHTVLYFFDLEFLEEQLEHAFFVYKGVHDCLSDEDSGILRVIDADLLERIFQQNLHIFPVLNNTLRSRIA